MDFSFLANPTALQLPDPTAMAIRGQTLANLTQQNQEGQIKLDAARRMQEGQDALAQVLPALQAAGYSREAIQQALQAQPKAAPFLLDYLDKKRKGDQDYEKTGAEIQDKKADANKKDMDRKLAIADKFGNEAAWLADHPKLTPEMVADYQKRVAGAGLQDVLRTVPFEDWADPNKARDALKANSMQFYDIKDRIVNQETGRHNLATEGIQRDQNMETGRHNRTTEGIQGGTLAETRRHNQVGEANTAATTAASKWVNDLERGVQVNMSTGETRPITAAGAPIGPRKDAKQATQTERALAVIDMAEPLIDKATGSYAGAAIDQGARVFGKSTEGADAGAQLKALEGALMMNQPRMEGPQSDKDVALYKQMAGQIGDTTVPASQKKIALQTIRELHQKYADIGTLAPGAKPKGPSKPAAPRMGEVRDGYMYKGGDPASPTSWEKAQ